MCIRDSHMRGCHLPCVPPLYFIVMRMRDRDLIPNMTFEYLNFRKYELIHEQLSQVKKFQGSSMNYERMEPLYTYLKSEYVRELTAAGFDAGKTEGGSEKTEFIHNYLMKIDIF
eukprot:TRINITY_DN12487_c0_g1_i4.p2 TRINITY_DN12487_c0_g1~~TRINITY_DN12487_c0_g1_i4.p2  ORF type:complete len:134 (-),score=44.63 TRINITY_DN12487_c0_g1_i4:136-477(-)